MTSPYTTEQVNELAGSFVTAQEVAPAQALQVAEEILGSADDIAAAALAWSRTRVMPTEPEVYGYTPELLAERFSPTLVFTGLMLLRSDPVTGREVLAQGICSVE